MTSAAPGATAPAGEATQALCQFVARTPWEAVPAAVRHEAKRALLNHFAVALGGCRDAAVDITLEVMSPFAGAAAASVIGRGLRTDALLACSLNAIAANVFDFDDTHGPTIIHPTAPVAPPLWALAEAGPMTGAELLRNFVLGVEVACRIGNAVSPWHYSHGWHITSTCGVFGAAAAAARHFGLDAGQVRQALGSASAQASGLVQTLGTMAKSIGVGHAARNGLLSALLARSGFTGPAQPLEGERGFLGVTGQQANVQALSDGLGQQWALMANTYKPYPCGVVLNPVIEATLQIAARPGFDAQQVEAITVSGHPLLRQRTDRPQISTGREAQVSAQHAVAVALLRRRAGLLEFNDAAVADPVVRALAARVQVRVDEQHDVDGARVDVSLLDGRVWTEDIAQARGSLARPLTDSDLEHKLRELAAFGGSACPVSRLIDAVWSLDTLADAALPVQLAAVGARR